jgi:hypothetical protein
MLHDTEQYLLKYLICVSTSVRTIMRGASLPAWDRGFEAESPRIPFSSVSIADHERIFGWDKSSFSGTSRCSMAFNGRRHIGGLSLCTCSRIQQCSRQKLPELSSQLERPKDALHMRLCHGTANGNFSCNLPHVLYKYSIISLDR